MSSLSGTIYIHPPKNQAKGQLENVQDFGKLDELAKRASLIVFETSSVFPLLLPFKDEITICINRVTISKKGVFTREEYPLPIENVTGARVYTNFCFASLSIDTFGIPKPDPISNLRIHDARLARRYILALIECKKANIDLSGLDIAALREKLKKIGMVRYSTDEKDYHNL